MQAPNQTEREAFQRIANRPEGALFLQYLSRNMANTNHILHYSDDPALVRKAQGMAVVLDVLIAGFKP